MEAANMHNKLILAVVQEDDYDATVSELNQNGFFVTMLSSTGGFWKKKNITIMLGVEESRLPQAMDILKRCAGKRKQTVYSSVSMPAAGQYAAAMPSIPMNMEFGGVTVFVLDLAQLEKFCFHRSSPIPEARGASGIFFFAGSAQDGLPHIHISLRNFCGNFAYSL